MYKQLCLFLHINSKSKNLGKRRYLRVSPASISLYLDSNILRNPFQAILPPFVLIQFERNRTLINEIYNEKKQPI
jgi:hypothetical protein